MNEEKLDIGDAFGEDATPAEEVMVEEWLQEARAAKRRHKVVDRFAALMLWGYIAGVILMMLVATICPIALIVGMWVLGGSFVLNLALVVAETIINYRRLKNRSTLYEQPYNTMS